jgi:hypothetical protein
MSLCVVHLLLILSITGWLAIACSANQDLFWNARTEVYDLISGYLSYVPTPVEDETSLDGAALCGLVHSTNMHAVSNDWSCTAAVPNTPYCGDSTHKKWSGLTCNENGRVTGINFGFTDYFVQGHIDSSIHHLTEVTHLDFHHQMLKGPIQPELGNLPKLEYLDLSVNFFTGVLPDSIREFKKREGKFIMYGNQLDH